MNIRKPLSLAAAVIAFIVGFAFFASQPARAIPVTWDAGGGGGAITNGGGAWLGVGLWNNAGAAASWTSGDDATFGGPATAGGAVTLASPTTVNSLTFNQFTGTYTLGTAAQTITLNNGITKNASSATVAFASPLLLGAAQTWTNNSTSNITVSGANTLNNGGFDLTIGGTGNTSMVNGAGNTMAISGAGGIIKNGTGQLILDSNPTVAHTFGGNITVNGGSIGFQTASVLSGKNTKITDGYLGGRFSSHFTWTGGLGTGANQIQITGGTSGLSGEGGNISNFQIGNTAGATLIWGALGEGAATGFFNPTVFLANGTDRMNANGKGSLNNGIDLNGTSRTITSTQNTDGAANSGFIISGAIINSSGTAGLTKTGPGNLILGGANTYNGATTISGGFLTIGTGAATGSLNTASAISVASGATFRIFQNDTVTQGTEFSAAAITGAGGFTQAGTGTTVLNNVANTYSGVTRVDAGVLSVSRLDIGSANSSIGSAGNAASNLLLGNNSTLRFVGDGVGTDSTDRNFTINGSSAGHSATLDASGAGSETIAFTNTSSPAYGTNNQTRTLNLAGTNTADNSLAANISNNGTGAVTLNKSGAGRWILTGASGYSGGTNVIAGSLGIGSNTAVGTGVLNIGGTNSNTPTIFASGAARTIANNTVLLATSLGGNPTIAGANDLTINGTTTASGAARTLTVNNSAATTLAGSVFLSNDDTTAGRGLTINGTGNTLISGVVANNNAGNTLAATLTKGGGGTLTLTNANTYSGLTTVTAGTLLANNTTGSATGTGNVTVNNASIFGGTGSISGTLSLNNTSTLSPGASIESLASGALSMASGTTFIFEALNNTATGADLMVVNGLLSLTAVNLDLTGANLAAGTWTAGDKLTLISYDNPFITSGFTGYTDDTIYLFGSNQWQFNYDDTTPGSNYISEATGDRFVTMTFVAIPEPSSLMMLAFGMISLWMFRKHR